MILPPMSAPREISTDMGVDMRPVREASYFATCERNEKGHCLPGEGGGESALKSGIRGAVALHSRADKAIKSFLNTPAKRGAYVGASLGVVATGNPLTAVPGAIIGAALGRLFA